MVAISMIIVYTGLSKEKVESYGLVLLSHGIVHQAVRRENGWELRIDPSQLPRLRT